MTVGAACSLSTLQKEVEEALAEEEEERSRGYRALLQTLRCLAGKQIRNVAVGAKGHELRLSTRRGSKTTELHVSVSKCKDFTCHYLSNLGLFWQTVGGNLLSANPKYDLSSVLAALDCTLHIASKGALTLLE